MKIFFLAITVRPCLIVVPRSTIYALMIAMKFREDVAVLVVVVCSVVVRVTAQEGKRSYNVA